MTPTYSPAVGARAVLQAAKFAGLTEVRNNAAWDNLDTPGRDAVAEELRAELLRTGWQLGWPYCAAFAEVVWRRAYQGRTELPVISSMLNPHCLTSFRNAAERGWTSKTPQVGAIGIMKKGDSSSGHAFIVAGIEGSVLHTIEGNTSPAPGSPEADREGDGVYRKKRPLSFAPTTGLHLIGFILPCVEQ